MKFYDIVGKSLSPQETQEVVPSQHQSPHRLMQPDPLLYSSRRDGPETAGDVAFRLLQQPFSEVAVNLGGSQPQLFGRNLAEVGSALRLANFFHQPSGQWLRVG